MKLEALEYNIVSMESAAAGVAEIVAASDQQLLKFQIITYTEKPIALSHHISDAIDDNNIARAHALYGLFLAIYYLNREQVDGFLRDKHEARKLPV